METIGLTNNEVFFICAAADTVEGAFDFENYDEDNFLLFYGLSKDAVHLVAGKLRKEMRSEMKRRGITRNTDKAKMQ